MPNISSESPRQPEFSRVLPSQVGQKDSHPQAEEAYQPVTTYLQIGNELHGISTHADCPAHIKAMHE